VPDVQPRRIQQIAKDSPVQIQIRVIQVTDDRCEYGNPQDDTGINIQQEQRQVGEAVVDSDLHPVKTHVPDPIEFPNAMVQLVEFPEKWNAMKEIVDEEFQEVFGNEEHDKLQPERSRGQEPDGFRYPRKTWEPCLG